MTSPQQSQPALTTRSRPESSKVLLIESDRKQLKLLSQTLRSLVGRVDCFSELSGLADMGSIGDYDLIIADYDGLAPEGRQVLVNAVSASIARPRLLLFSEGKNKDDLVTLFDERSLTNLVARNADVEIDDLIVTVQKIMRKDIFGIEKYFCWGVEALTLEVSSSADKPAVLAEAEKFAGLIGIHPRMTNLLCTVADEFVTNAIYNAPMNKGGQPRYSHRPRTETVVLEPEERVQIKFCSDGRRLGISASDPFGSLSPETVQDYLAKCMRKGADQVDQKEGGAGLGLYYVFESISHFVVNISPGRRTEMIGLFDIRGTYKDFVARNKSFNIFISD